MKVTLAKWLVLVPTVRIVQYSSNLLNVHIRTTLEGHMISKLVELAVVMLRKWVQEQHGIEDIPNQESRDRYHR